MRDIKMHLQYDRIVNNQYDHKYFDYSILPELNKKGVYTIEDLINSDIDELFKEKTNSVKTSWKGKVAALRTKYLEEPLSTEEFLYYTFPKTQDKEELHNRLKKIFNILGLESPSQKLVDTYYLEDVDNLRTIDFISRQFNEFGGYYGGSGVKTELNHFYIQYDKKKQHEDRFDAFSIEELADARDKIKALYDINPEIFDLVLTKDIIDNRIALLDRKIDERTGKKYEK